MSITDEEYDQIMRQVPVRTVIRREDKNIDQLQQEEQEKKRLEKIQQRNAQLFASQEQINKNVEEAALFNITLGRDKLLTPGLDLQCLWSDSTCKFCDKPVKELMEGWCGWGLGKPGAPERGIEYESHSVNDQNNFHVIHKCERNIDILSKKVEHLQAELAKTQKQIPDLIRNAIWANTVGR